MAYIGFGAICSQASTGGLGRCPIDKDGVCTKLFPSSHGPSFLFAIERVAPSARTHTELMQTFTGLCLALCYSHDTRPCWE